MTSTPYRVGDYRFDSTTGELRPLDGKGEGTRLPPQPAKLLRLLVERRGGLLTREAIEAELWRDVHVDVDQALGFCVRQVRDALGDSAADPGYVETLPRRGYRLLVPVDPLPPEDTQNNDASTDSSANPTGPSFGRLGLGVLLAVALLSVGWLALRSIPAPQESTPAPTPAVRLAIMPFTPPPGRGLPDTTAIAEILLVELGREPSRVGVVGPRTTGAYEGSFASWGKLTEDYELDYILNGRFIELDSAAPNNEPELLVELIRVDDGVHVWVERFPASADPQAVAETVGAAVGERLLR